MKEQVEDTSDAKFIQLILCDLTDLPRGGKWIGGSAGQAVLPLPRESDAESVRSEKVRLRSLTPLMTLTESMSP